MFGERLKALRAEMGLSQKALASKLFISQQAVAGWELEKGSPNPETLVKIADILNVSTDYLLGCTDQREKKQPAPMIEGGLSEEQLEVIRRYDAAPPALRAAALAVLKAAEEQHKAQGGGTGEK